MRLFHHTNNDEFHLLPLWCGKWDTSFVLNTPRASPATIGHWDEQNIQQIINKEKVKEKKFLPANIL